MFTGLKSWGRDGSPDGLGRAGAVIAVLACTAAGYFQGRRLQHWTGPEEEDVVLVPAGAQWREVQ